jgi:hypothetical protein
MISMYKITKFIQFFTTSVTTSNSNLDKKRYIKEIIGEYSIRGKNKRSRGRRGLTLKRIMLHRHKIFRDYVQKGKEMLRTGQDRAPPLFCPSRERALSGGYEIEMLHSNTCLSLYGMGDASAFVIKGGAPLYTEWEMRPLL